MISADGRRFFSRSAGVRIMSLRFSGGASYTTPSPKIGRISSFEVGCGSKTSSGWRKNTSCASAPEKSTTSRPASVKCPSSPHSLRTRVNREMGSRRSAISWPVRRPPPESEGIGLDMAARLRHLHCKRNVNRDSLLAARPGPKEPSMSATAPVPGPAFEALPRAQLLPVALETMHVGHLLDRALMPQVVIATKSVDTVDQIAIEEWMGASPVYTGRMRKLMGVEGDGVGAIIKALQLDVGFPHQYMDVAYKLNDE